MTIIHRNENTRVRPIEGGAIYLSPQYGKAIYLSPQGHGLPDFGSLTGNISGLIKRGVAFANENKDLIKTAVDAGSNVVNTINNIRHTVNEVEKVKQIRELNKQLAERKRDKKKKDIESSELTEEQKKIIEETIKGSGLKRF